MPRRKVTRESFEALMASYRSLPGDFSAAARASGLDRRTARKAWEQGLPPHGFGRSVQELFAQEQVQARAKMAEAEAAKLEVQAKAQAAAVEQAAASRVREAQVVGIVGQNSLQVSSISGRLLALGRRLLAKVEAVVDPTACQHCGRGGDPALYEAFVKSGSGSALTTVERVVRVAAMANQQVQVAMQLERLHLGEPTDILGIRGGGPSKPVTVEEAKRVLEDAAKAIEGSERRAAAKPPAVPPKASIN